jgi:mannose-6-phosphate isomerase-like protein (cupin superfamily)
MELVHTDQVFRVAPGTSPDYNRGNTLIRLLTIMETHGFACGRGQYLGETLEWLFPFDFLELYGPAGADADQLDVALQDNKTDFQKQNVRDFLLGDTVVVRGYAAAGFLVVPFLRISYRAGPDSQLARTAGGLLGPQIALYLKVGANALTELLEVPYDPVSDRYAIELWSYPPGDLRPVLDAAGQAAFDRGALVVRNDLVQGTRGDFVRDGSNDVYLANVTPGHAMHPVLPLHVECAWADESATFWDSRNGANHHYEFSMVVRGWDQYLAAGISPNPHGGVGFLEYRNLLSNYGRYAGRNELGRELDPWNFDAHGSKTHGGRPEPFLAVDYMDLHILKPECGIGLHRHRDNQEVFLMMDGHGYMVVGDWAQRPFRERCFELRTLRAGHFAMLKGGQLHGLMNPGDSDLSLFMFGGYD